MKIAWVRAAGAWLVCSTIVLLAESTWAHMTLRPNQPLRPGGFATVSLVVPNERHVDTTRVTLEVPEAFLKAGGRLSRVEYPSGWKVNLEKEDKPGEIYRQEKDERAKREAKREGGAEHGATSAKTDQERREQEILDELRKKWIKKAAFEGGSIPPDGFMVFLLNLELPNKPGKFQFPATQVYADGKEVSWSELVEGAEHPAATIMVEQPYDVRNAALWLSAVALLIALISPARRFLQRKQSRPDRLTPVHKA